MDNVVSILLSGAVVGIISPLLKEQGGRSTHELLAKIGNLVAERGSDAAHEGMFRVAYNSLKHSGSGRAKVNPSADLEIDHDLRMEAAHMLDAARDDFRNITVSANVRRQLSQEFVALLEAVDDYA